MRLPGVTRHEEPICHHQSEMNLIEAVSTNSMSPIRNRSAVRL